MKNLRHRLKRLEIAVGRKQHAHTCGLIVIVEYGEEMPPLPSRAERVRTGRIRVMQFAYQPCEASDDSQAHRPLAKALADVEPMSL